MTIKLTTYSTEIRSKNFTFFCMCEKNCFMNLCSFCKTNQRRKNGGYCASCHALYMSINRPRYSDLDPYEKRKVRARSIANTYQKRGKLIPKPCEFCGSKRKIEKHHENYSKPLEVKWMCRGCHKGLHSGRIITPEMKALIDKHLKS